MTNEKHKDRWLWYPGDFEIRHGLLQNFQYGYRLLLL